MNLALRRVGILTALLASVHPYLGAREERFELRGKITLEEESFRDLSGTVFLEGATFPFTTSALVGRARELDPAHFSFPQLVLAEIYRQRGTHEALARELDQFLRLHPDIDGAEYLREVLDMAREAAKNPE
jgi:hypothetical protein